MLQTFIANRDETIKEMKKAKIEDDKTLNLANQDIINYSKQLQDLQKKHLELIQSHASLRHQLTAREHEITSLKAALAAKK
ncbi:hypothetical protein Mgra_00003977 [Meloidogyne graminicola]|uniref:Uncharacterized protein n=1 Tax=Meloidogyne graminicola TaxID=189291 RepID=A0A8S9ZTC8_9BILA|nr:hypothetical protein Mgra_00003977 [Meloidogyne graminicola]